jgi:hypothetical protein
MAKALPAKVFFISLKGQEAHDGMTRETPRARDDLKDTTSLGAHLSDGMSEDRPSSSRLTQTKAHGLSVNLRHTCIPAQGPFIYLNPDESSASPRLRRVERKLSLTNLPVVRPFFSFSLSLRGSPSMEDPAPEPHPVFVHMSWRNSKLSLRSHRSGYPQSSAT